jgi:predicted nucleic acid-binding protein
VILVDTSSWIHFLRTDGDLTVRARVDAALRSGAACWCPTVRLELWNGAAGAREKKVMREFERVLPELAISDNTWRLAVELARQCRAAGVTVPATDVLIAACAREHGARLEHADHDFDLIRSAVGDDAPH